MKNAGYCFACRHFSTNGQRAEITFAERGFSDWKHALGKKGIISNHNVCFNHVNAMHAWCDYKETVARGCSIANRLETGRSELITKNRHYIRSVSEALLFCAPHEIALRGHDKSTSSVNRGNFKALMSLIARHDPVVKDRLSDGPRNAQYISPNIQNALLQIMDDKVQSAICNEVKNTEVFTLIADETNKDLGKKEQLSLVLRYVDQKAICPAFTKDF